MRLLKDVIQSLQWRYGAFVAATVFFALIALLPPELLVYFTDKAQTLGAANAKSFIAELLVFGTLVSVTLFFASIGKIFSHEWLRLRFEAELRRRILRRVHAVPLSALDGASRGDWLARVTKDLEQVDWFLTESVPGQIRNAAIIVGAGTLFCFHGGWLALFPLATALALGLLNLRLQRKLARELIHLRELHGSIFQSLIESLEGIRTIRAYGAEPFLERRFESKLGEIASRSLGLIRFVGLLIGGNELVGQLMITVCLSAVAWSLSRGALTTQAFLIYPFFIGMFYYAAQSLAGSAYDWSRFFAEGGRLAALLYGEDGRNEAIPRGMSLAVDPVALSVSELTVGYAGDVVAGPFDLTLQRGELVSIMGPSGCGKSTLLEVMAGLRPAMAGEIALYGAEKGNRASVMPGRDVAYVEQHPYIFQGSLRENLVFGNSGRVSDAAIWAALERAGLDRYAAQNGGLEHALHDRGRNLSEGERYRIALCRALLLRRPFVLLDEPFAALDPISVGIVVRTLHSEKRNAGILVVTHVVPDGLAVDRTFRLSGRLSAVRALPQGGALLDCIASI